MKLSFFYFERLSRVKLQLKFIAVRIGDDGVNAFIHSPIFPSVLYPFYAIPILDKRILCSKIAIRKGLLLGALSNFTR